MSSPEIASISELQEYKSPVETFRAFDDLYSSTELGRYGYSVLLDRIVHIDGPTVSSIKMVIAQERNSRLLPAIRGHAANGQLTVILPYQETDFVLAMTDGTTITEHEVLSAHSTYHGPVGGVDIKNDPKHEKTFHMAFRHSESTSMSTIDFEIESGEGTVNIANGPFGWILKASESSQRAEQLRASADITEAGRIPAAS